VRPPPPPPPVTRTEVKPPRWPLLLGLGQLLLAAAGGAGTWWWLTRSEAPAPGPIAVAPPPPPPAQPTTPPPPPPPARPGWPEAADPLTPREVVNQAPSQDALLAVARRRQQQGRHEDALLLFLTLADRNVAVAMTALGRMYSPVNFPERQPFNSPDPRQAALFLRRAADAGDAEAVALRAQLKTWLEARAAQGNPTARDTLAEFW
jgi:hypothetical protein